MRLLYRVGGMARGYDWILFAAAGVLAVIGLTAIYSVDMSRGARLVFFPTQLLAFGIGIVVATAAAHFHVRFLESATRPMYVLAIGLLLSVLFFGQTIRGTTGWFRVGSFSFQPSEFGKVALLMALAYIAARQGRRFDKLGFVARSGVITLALSLPVLLQPDAGSALVFFAVWFGLLILTGAKWRYLAGIIGVLAAVFIAGWFFLFQDFQRDRLTSFFNPGADPLGSGYNVAQSIIAVGAGEIRGRGLGFGSQSQLHFLPEAQTDFIFAVIAEELGFLGACALLFLYGLILWRLSRIARQCPNDFGSYAVMCIALLFFVQIALNLGAAMGIMPVTGLTLPLVSYGGTSLIIMLFLVGLAESAAKYGGGEESGGIIYG